MTRTARSYSVRITDQIGPVNVLGRGFEQDKEVASLERDPGATVEVVR